MSLPWELPQVVDANTSSNSDRILSQESLETSMFRSIRMNHDEAPSAATLQRHHSHQPQMALPKRQPLFRHSHSSPVFSEGVKKATSSSTSNDEGSSLFVWTVKNLEPVPMFHPLERTAWNVADISVATIAERISNYLRLKSIQSDYQATRVSCTTQHLCSFSVQLWQGEATDGADATAAPTIIEVSRRQGCSIQLQRIRRELHEVIMTGQYQPKNDTRTMAQKLRPYAVVERLCNQALAQNNQRTTQELKKSSDPDAISICMELLESDLWDQNRLGLESLCILTDPTKVSWELVQTVSQKLVLGATDKDSSSFSLQNKLEDYFLGIDASGSSNSKAEEKVDHDSFPRRKAWDAMHLLALRAVAQALECVAATRSNELGMDLSSPFWDIVMRALVHNVESASSRPLEASVSIKSLRLVTRLVEQQGTHQLKNHFSGLQQDCRSTMMMMVPELESARNFGKQHHFQLEQECQQFLGHLAH